jgi:hypothetical protein
MEALLFDTALLKTCNHDHNGIELTAITTQNAGLPNTAFRFPFLYTSFSEYVHT